MKRRDRDRIIKAKCDLYKSWEKELTTEEKEIRKKRMEKLKKTLAIPIVLSDYPYK